MQGGRWLEFSAPALEAPLALPPTVTLLLLYLLATSPGINTAERDLGDREGGVKSFTIHSIQLPA